MGRVAGATLIDGHSAAGRRKLAIAACVAAAGVAAIGAPAAEAHHGPPAPPGQAVPVPIAGGTKVPRGPLIHGLVPGPKGRSLPFSKLPLGGLHQDPSTIGNFSGTSALAYLVGTARDSTGKVYNLEADMRVFRGAYIASDGKRRFGTFGFIWVDLFELGSGSQVHDFNARIRAKGLFWTVRIPPDAFTVSRDGKRATLRLRNVTVVDSFKFLGPREVPARVSVTVNWTGLGAPQARGAGLRVAPTNPAAFLGRFRVARATGSASGSEAGFSFTSGPLSSARGYAQLGSERNGRYLR